MLSQGFVRYVFVVSGVCVCVCVRVWKSMDVCVGYMRTHKAYQIKVPWTASTQSESVPVSGAAHNSNAPKNGNNRSGRHRLLRIDFFSCHRFPVSIFLACAEFLHLHLHSSLRLQLHWLNIQAVEVSSWVEKRTCNFPLLFSLSFPLSLLPSASQSLPFSSIL